jgi:hypothetical protein
LHVIVVAMITFRHIQGFKLPVGVCINALAFAYIVAAMFACNLQNQVAILSSRGLRL